MSEVEIEALAEPELDVPALAPPESRDGAPADDESGRALRAMASTRPAGSFFARIPSARI